VGDDLSVVATVEAMGVDAAARRYVSYMSGADEPGDLTAAIWSGDDEDGNKLPTEWLWNLSLAVIHHCPDDDEMLWRLGDGPIDNNCVDPEIGRRLFEVRDTDPKVMLLFLAMRRMLPSKWGVSDGPWFD
jgi:hypothetical protein